MQWHIAESHWCQILNKNPQPAALSEGCPPIYLCFVVGFLFPSAFHLSGFYFHSFCSFLLAFVLSCFVFFYCIWGISVTLRSLGGMSGMFWFNTSLPELSFDKSINICGFWGQSIGMHRKMKQPACKAGMRTGKLDSAVGSEREDSGVLASGARGWQIKLRDFSNSEAKHMTEKTRYVFQAGRWSLCSAMPEPACLALNFRFRV